MGFSEQTERLARRGLPCVRGARTLSRAADGGTRRAVVAGARGGGWAWWPCGACRDLRLRRSVAYAC